MSSTTSSNNPITITPSPRPPFPIPGSTLTNDGKYFSLGKLGRGTFCEIYKCIDLSCHHTIPVSNSNSNNNNNSKKKNRLRICAAKIELSTFANSGVLDGEANVLQFLSDNMNNQTPLFCDYIKPPMNANGFASGITAAAGGGMSNGIISNSSNHNIMGNESMIAMEQINASASASATITTNPDNNNTNNHNNYNNIRAIIMEYLPGEDMHQLRDRHSQTSSKKAMKLYNPNNNNDKNETYSSTQSKSQQIQIIQPTIMSSQYYRRLKLSDAVYLCADVILPLLQSMHNCGMIHRDVKPSNCVRIGTDDNNKMFKLVDFGLSKSFIVPESSSFADSDHPWDRVWHIPESMSSSNNGGGSGNGSNAFSSKGCMRKERPVADFRGTSMYASLRVHQGCDHCRRDDLWGLMYVFCDLVSGGLPWMKYAANRERAVCQRMKEWVHGERLTFDAVDDNDHGGAGGDGNDDNNNGIQNSDDNNNNNSAAINDSNRTNENNSNDNKFNNGGLKKKITNDRVEEMLKGVDYHTSTYERQMIERKQKENNNSNKPYNKPLPPIAPTLEMSKDKTKVNALRKAFNHLAELKYADEPDYNLIKECLKEFSQDKIQPKGVKTEDMALYPINWNQPSQHELGKRKWEKMGNWNRDLNDNNNSNKKMTTVLSFVDTDDLDPLVQETIDEAESLNQLNLAQQEIVAGNGAQVMESYLSRDSLNYSEIQDLQRLPLQLQFHLAQVEYNALHPTTIPIHLALRDWMYLASSLVNDKWDTATYERGNHRSNDDGYRRQVLMRICQQCMNAAKPFNNFCHRDCFYYDEDSDDDDTRIAGSNDNGSRKRRKIFANDAKGDIISSAANSCFLAFSRLFCSLKALIENEKERLTAPPPALSMK